MVFLVRGPLLSSSFLTKNCTLLEYIERNFLQICRDNKSYLRQLHQYIKIRHSSIPKDAGENYSLLINKQDFQSHYKMKLANGLNLEFDSNDHAQDARNFHLRFKIQMVCQQWFEFEKKFNREIIAKFIQDYGPKDVPFSDRKKRTIALRLVLFLDAVSILFLIRHWDLIHEYYSLFYFGLPSVNRLQELKLAYYHKWIHKGDHFKVIHPPEYKVDFYALLFYEFYENSNVIRVRTLSTSSELRNSANSLMLSEENSNRHPSHSLN